MRVLAYFWSKKESFSAHTAWGAFLGLIAAHRVDDAFLAIPLAAFLRIGWEVATARITRGEWRPAILDVAPWVLGGGLAALLEVVAL